MSLTVRGIYFLSGCLREAGTNTITQYDRLLHRLVELGVFRLDLSQTSLTCQHTVLYGEEKETPPKVMHALYTG